MDHDYNELFMGLTIAFALAVVLFVTFISAPCHGGFSDFNEGQFCKECGEPRYHLCECGHKLHGNYCTYCGAKNEFLED